MKELVSSIEGSLPGITQMTGGEQFTWDELLSFSSNDADVEDRTPHEGRIHLSREDLNPSQP